MRGQFCSITDYMSEYVFRSRHAFIRRRLVFLSNESKMRVRIRLFLMIFSPLRVDVWCRQSMSMINRNGGSKKVPFLL